PPVVLEFLTPNGSMVNGPAIELLYTFRTMRSRTGGRELTQQEVHDLALDGITMCFQVLSFMIITSCSPVTQAPLTIQNALPAAWHKVAGWLLYDAPTSSNAESASAALFRSGEDGRDEVIQNAGAGAGDSVSVFLSLDGHPDLPLCGESACLESSDARSTYFDQIYKRKNWRRGESSSGEGSEVSSTTTIRSTVEQVIPNYEVTSILDAPCGDLTWMPLVKGIGNVRYTGADISATIVEDNRRKFGQVGVQAATRDSDAHQDTSLGTMDEKGDKGLRDPVFVQVDLVEEVPTARDGQPFDLIFVRDMMLHLPTRHNLRVLENVQASGARLFMASTFLNGDENVLADTFVPARGHLISLAKAPYCLRPPIALYHDDSTGYADHHMGLWELDPARPLIG
ncbi:unnamed protein product, partial [Sphacelaria rigidula]